MDNAVVQLTGVGLAIIILDRTFSFVSRMKNNGHITKDFLLRVVSEIVRTELLPLRAAQDDLEKKVSAVFTLFYKKDM